MLRTRIVAPFTGLLTLGPAWPVSGPSRQPATGLLAATRTGLPPAGDDKLTNTKKTPWHYATVSPPALLGARKPKLT